MSAPTLQPPILAEQYSPERRLPPLGEAVRAEIANGSVVGAAMRAAEERGVTNPDGRQLFERFQAVTTVLPDGQDGTNPAAQTALDNIRRYPLNMALKANGQRPLRHHASPSERLLDIGSAIEHGNTRHRRQATRLWGAYNSALAQQAAEQVGTAVISPEGQFSCQLADGNTLVGRVTAEQVADLATYFTELNIIPRRVRAGDTSYLQDLLRGDATKKIVAAAAETHLRNFRIAATRSSMKDHDWRVAVGQYYGMDIGDQTLLQRMGHELPRPAVDSLRAVRPSSRVLRDTVGLLPDTQPRPDAGVPSQRQVTAWNIGAVYASPYEGDTRVAARMSDGTLVIGNIPLNYLLAKGCHQSVLPEGVADRLFAPETAQALDAEATHTHGHRLSWAAHRLTRQGQQIFDLVTRRVNPAAVKEIGTGLAARDAQVVAEYDPTTATFKKRLQHEVRGSSKLPVLRAFHAGRFAVKELVTSPFIQAHAAEVAKAGAMLREYSAFFGRYKGPLLVSGIALQELAEVATRVERNQHRDDPLRAGITEHFRSLVKGGDVEKLAAGLFTLATTGQGENKRAVLGATFGEFLTGRERQHAGTHQPGPEESRFLATLEAYQRSNGGNQQRLRRELASLSAAWAANLVASRAGFSMGDVILKGAAKPGS